MKRLLVVFGLISILLLVSVIFAVADNSQKSEGGLQNEETLQSIGAKEGVEIEAEDVAMEDIDEEEHHGEDHGKASFINFGWRFLNFVVLIIVLYKLSAKAIMNFFVDDRESIKTSLEGAVAAKEEAEKRLEEHSARLDKAAAEIQEISGMIKAQGLAEKEWKLRRYGKPWQKGETTSLSIGQGFTLVTPLQLLRAYCAIANGGVLYKPRLIKRIETTDGQIVEEFPPEKERIVPVSKKNIDILRHALWGVVNEPHGTGWALKRKERDVCGKTGTAQVISMSEDTDDDVDDVQYKFRDHALFVCFAPYKDPAIAIMVIVEHGGHGGSVAAPIARRIVDGYFNLERKREKM